MLSGDMPAISSSTYASAAVPLGAFNLGRQAANAGLLGNHVSNLNNAAQYANLAAGHQRQQAAPVPQPKEPHMSATRRLVKVVIVDPNENIPLDKCLLYSGEEKLTDATDQELFFEIDIKDILARHNERRVKIADKKVKERTEFLEPAKIRDLKMVVVNVASF